MCVLKNWGQDTKIAPRLVGKKTKIRDKEKNKSACRIQEEIVDRIRRVHGLYVNST